LEPQRSSRQFWRAAVIFGLWTVFGVLSALQVYVRDLRGLEGASPFELFNIVYFYWAWALLTPVLLRLGRGIASDERRWPARIVPRLPLAIGAMAVQSAIYAAMAAFEPEIALAGLPENAAGAFLRHLPGNVLLIATIVGAFVAFRFYQNTQARLLRASELESSLTTARLESLKTQLHPHFLFNTLNLISALVAKRDTDGAVQAIARLGDLLRASLAANADQLVPVEHELEITRRYLDIAKLRFGDRLQVHESLDDRAARAQVPALLLQPLVENALQHAIARQDRGGTIWIALSTHGNVLRVSVEDDGPGFNGGSTGGLGLANTRDRLKHLYQDRASLTTGERSGGGASVVVEIPVRA
jgi:two-component system LytT family sensor kinase